MQYLILGAGGYIGSYLYERMLADGKDVTGTRHMHAASGSCLYYDILKDEIQPVIDSIKGPGKTAVMCIAQADINRCMEDYSLAYEINVVRTKQLLRELRKNGFYTIYFSTDNVFDGEEGNYTEDSGTHGLNQYGRMKEEMEQYLQQQEPEVCILRISKVVSKKRVRQNLFFEWEKQGETGQVRCVRGNRLSFVAIEDLYQSCLLAAQRKLHGLYQVAGDQAYSRAQLAELFFQKAGNHHVVIKECPVGEFAFKDARPLNLGMSNRKFRQETGYSFTSMETAIQEYLAFAGSDKKENSNGIY